MTRNEENVDISNLLYDKTIKCPICEHEFKVRSVKTSAYRVKEKDSDFFINYTRINPYFYDVWLCNTCGYTAIKTDFEKIREIKKELIIKNISSKWSPKVYPLVYDERIAIERYKLALINYTAINAESYKKSMICLKIAWIYRILKEVENENKYIKNALDGFLEAYYKEDFPMYGMDRSTVMYLIGELHRRCSNNEEALLWFGNVITSSMSSQKIKDMARKQKDLIKSTDEKYRNADNNENQTKKKFPFLGLF
jgi:uncharacterized protein (DUF2225 family)